MLERAFERAFLKALEQSVQVKAEELFRQALSPGWPVAQKLQEKMEQGFQLFLEKGIRRMRYIVLIRRTTTGYSADVPDLPGCVATGLTVEHARQQIAEAIQGHLDVMRESGDDAPAAKPQLQFAVDEDMGEEYCTWVEAAEEAEPLGARSGVATKQRPKRRRP